jgi:P27 family predicted phage terminase small subunit
MPQKKPKAPDHLAPATADWWLSVHADYSLEGHHVRLLTLACEAFDRGAQARDIIARDGLTIATGDGGLKAHPAVAIERDSRLAFARLVRELDLDVDPPATDAPPPALRSNRRT